MRGFLLPALLAGSFPAAALCGQTPTAVCQPGFAASVPFSERPQAFLVRGFAYDAEHDQHWLALGGTLFRRPDPWTSIPVLQLATDQIGLLCRPPGQERIWCTALQAGTVFSIDPGSGARISFPGVANAFDLAVGPAGEVIVSANPQWPAPAADSGLWLVGPAGGSRELLHLSGPSGPVHVDPAGNLLVAELGRIVPPPPGAVRLLRFPRARWQSAAGDGPALTVADADLVSTGWNGAYGLACDDQDRVYVSDANRADLLRTAPGTLQREPVPFCTLPATGLQLQFVSGKGAPFLPWQPQPAAGALLAASSNFINEFLVHRIAPQRPQFTATPGPVIAPGPALLQVSSAPAAGLAVFAASLATLRTEYVACRLDGTPLWCALDPSSPVATAVLPLDAAGSASLQLQHPGGFALAMQWQVLVLAPTNASHCSSAPLSLQLVP